MAKAELTIEIRDLEEIKNELNAKDQQLAELKAENERLKEEIFKWQTQYASAYVHRQNALIAEKVELQQQLKDNTKQVRKEVCEEIRNRFLATCQIEKGCDTASFSLEVLNRILDQLQESQGEKK